MWSNIKFWCFELPWILIWLIIVAPGVLIINFLEERTPFWRFRLTYRLQDIIGNVVGVVVWLTIGFGAFCWVNL